MELNQATVGKVVKIAEKALRSIGLKEIVSVFQYSVRKCTVTGKDESYLPLLFENEIEDYLARREINRMGRKNNVCLETA